MLFFSASLGFFPWFHGSVGAMFERDDPLSEALAYRAQCLEVVGLRWHVLDGGPNNIGLRTSKGLVTERNTFPRRTDTQKMGCMAFFSPDGF